MDTSTHLTKKRLQEVELPKKKDYVIQPNRVTNSIYDYTLIQERLLNSLIFYLQDAIKISFQNDDYKQLTLWKNLDDDQSISIKIPLKDISIPQHYDHVKKVIELLAGRVVKIPFINKDTNTPWIHIQSLFNAKLPVKSDWSSHIEIILKKDVAKYLIEIEKDDQGRPIQYTRFIYQIALNANNKYTAKIYKKLCSYRKKGGFVMPLEEFRIWLGIENKYKNYCDIEKRILVPVQEELENKADCWFNCKSQDFTTKKGNVVTHINFKVITPDLLKEAEMQKDHVFNLLRMHFKFEDRHIDQIRPIFDNSSTSHILQKIMELHEYYRDNVSRIKDITGYTISVLLNEFCSAKLI
jgi:hypothetical protein